jgi:hypothetical protein
MIAPIFGHNKLDGSANLVAILQLVNKCDGMITDHDVVSFHSVVVYNILGKNSKDVQVDWLIN